MNKITKIEIVIIIFLIIFFGFSFFYLKSFQKESKKEKLDTTISAVADVNRFFTIDSVVFKYFSYVTIGDSDSILKMLDKNYISKNNINSSNISSFVGTYNENIKGSLSEAYQFTSYNNIYKYYVKVVLSEETLYESNIQEYNYLIVTIDENTLTFAIEPISELVYNEKIKGED